MSRRDVNDKSTYTYLNMGMYHFSHGKITLDTKSSYVDGKEITCPNCKHEFIWDKFFNIGPRYPEWWYKSEKNTDNIPCGFIVEMEINTPSSDGCGNGDNLPRISYIIRNCKLTIEDRVNASDPKDAVTLRSADKKFTMELFEMGKEREMEYSNCCGAPFGHPGWPDCDICQACGEHADIGEEDEDNR